MTIGPCWMQTVVFDSQLTVHVEPELEAPHEPASTPIPWPASQSTAREIACEAVSPCTGVGVGAGGGASVGWGGGTPSSGGGSGGTAQFAMNQTRSASLW